VHESAPIMSVYEFTSQHMHKSRFDMLEYVFALHTMHATPNCVDCQPLLRLEP